jgi:energy-coupling factor transport system ATP-binding protein
MALGFEPPFVVKTAIGLLQQGCQLDILPIDMEELAKAVSSLCP